MNTKIKLWKKWLGIFLFIVLVSFTFGAERVAQVGMLTVVGTRFNPALWLPYFITGRYTFMGDDLIPVVFPWFRYLFIFISTIVYWVALSYIVLLLHDRLGYRKTKVIEKNMITP